MHENPIQFLHARQTRKDVTDFRTGDTVRVHWKVREGDKERVQPFEGVVIRKKKGQTHATFTVRKMSYGVGVERIFPLHSPRYEKIELLTKGDVNRNRLFYLRGLRGRASRVDAQEELLEGEAAVGTAPGEAPAAKAEPPHEPAKKTATAEAPEAPKAPKAAPAAKTPAAKKEPKAK